MNVRKDPTKVPMYSRQTAIASVNMALKPSTPKEDRGAYLLTALRLYRPAITDKIAVLKEQLELLEHYAAQDIDPDACEAERPAPLSEKEAGAELAQKVWGIRLV